MTGNDRAIHYTTTFSCERGKYLLIAITWSFFNMISTHSSLPYQTASLLAGGVTRCAYGEVIMRSSLGHS